MTDARAHPFTGSRAAWLVGITVAFVAGVDLLRAVRPALLSDAEPGWAAPRLVLGLAVAAGAAAAGTLAAALYALWARLPAARAPLSPLAWRTAAFVALSVGALAAGAALRFVSLSRVPESLWIDDLSLIAPARDLSGRPADFADAIRPAPYGVPKAYGSVGVLYLEGYRKSLERFGATVLGVRFPSALAGSLSIVTGALLARALLPAGGGALTALAVAGMRGHLILSRWSWNMIVLVPIVDLATLLVAVSRRANTAVAAPGRANGIIAGRWRPLALAAAGGVLAGVGAHVYLSAWPAAAALGLFALWPAERGEPARPRLLRAAAFGVAFAALAAPLFLLREGRTVPYFARTADHNVALEIRRTRSLLPPAAAAADTVVAPWLVPDPGPRHDLPGRSRLGLLLGIPAAIALARALVRPREPLSALLLAHAAAVLAATVAGGQADVPNGSRFAYLTTLAAICAAAGLLWLVGLAPRALRPAAGIAAVGVLAVSGALGARDALRVWPERPETFVGFHGQDTLIGRAAARWDRFGNVEVSPDLGHSPITIGAVRRYRLDPDDSSPSPSPSPPSPEPRGFRVRVAPVGDPGRPGERRVETVGDPWGKKWAVVWAKKS